MQYLFDEISSALESDTTEAQLVAWEKVQTKSVGCTDW